MTPKHRLFVTEYLVDLNATQAAIRAGYAPGSASHTGSRLLRRPEIAAAIDAGKRARAAKLDISADRILLELARIAFADIRDYATVGPDGLTLTPTTELTAAQTAAIAEVTESKTSRGGTIRFKLHDKLSALNALARHTGMSPPEKIALTDANGADRPEAADPLEVARRIAFILRASDPDAGAGGNKK